MPAALRGLQRRLGLAVGERGIGAVVEQGLRHPGIAEVSGPVEGRPLLCVARVGLPCAFVPQDDPWY